SIPATLITNIRVVQLLSYVYGNDLSSPYELMTSLKVFHAATLPKRYQGQAWEKLKDELHLQNGTRYFYNGDEKVITKEWLELGIQELVKILAVQLFQPKKEGKVPFLSMVLGISFQYKMSKKISEFAHKYYLYRYLLEQENK
ncbi:EcsC family protein, partial [Streptomyces gulbargensis]